MKSSKTCYKQINKEVSVMLDIFKALSTYLVVGHETPCKDAYFLIERDLVDTTGQVSAVAVNDVLEVLA